MFANNRGFSLIELVVVILIFGIAAGGLMTLFSTVSRKSADPLLENQAIQLAQEKMDGILGDRADAVTPRGFGWITSANYPAENPVAGFPGFSRSVTTSCVTSADLDTSTGAPPCTSGYTHVQVTVAHAALPGNVTVETVVTNY